MSILEDVNVGDTVKGQVSFRGPHPDDPHPENPSRTVQKTKTYEGLVLKKQESGVLIMHASGKMRLKENEIEEITERGESPEPVRFPLEVGENTYTVQWNPDTERYEVEDTSQFDVWAEPGGEVKCRLDVYKNVDDRVREDVRNKMKAVTKALRKHLPNR